MVARYLRSTTTGVVLPYNAKLTKRPNIQALSDEEADAYDASLGKKPEVAAAAPAPEPVPEPTPEPTPAIETLPSEDEVVFEQPEVAVSDVSAGEPSADDLLAALKVD